MSRRKHPNKALLDDLKELFEKHNWSGDAIAVQVSPTASSNLLDSAANVLSINSGCTPGQTLHHYKYQLPDGTWVFKTYCA